MTNRKLRAALLQRLKITPQALSQRVQKIKRQISVTTADATYLIAQQSGLILDRFLSPSDLDRVRTLHQQLPSTNSQPVPSRRTRQKESTVLPSRIILIGKEFKGVDPILPQTKLSEAREMAAIYPLLYVLENSIREVIDKIMTKQHGPNWFDSQATIDLKKKLSVRMATENKNAWHQRRGSRPIDYLDLNELPVLMRKIQDYVVPSAVNPSLEWFTQMVDEVYQSRCVLCHMNPLDPNNVQAVKVRLTFWQRQINAKKNLIL